jgi:hypothetical protein
MPEKENPADFHRLARLAKKMRDKGYRDGYVAAHTRQVLAKQMREFRGAMPQTEFANLIDKRQTMVSRLENPNYSGWTVGTLLEIASKLNVAVFVRFVDFLTFLKYSGDQSESALHPVQYNQQQVDDFARAEADRETISIEPSEDILPKYEYSGVGVSIPAQMGDGATLISNALISVTPGINVLNIYENALANLPTYAPSNLNREIAARDAKIFQLENKVRRLENALLARFPAAQKPPSPTQELILTPNSIARGTLELH